MTPAQVAARMTWITTRGTELDDETRALLRLGAGGLILFSRNVASVEQVARLCRDARAKASGPLRIAADQEGGHILRLAEPLTRLPSLMGIGATGSPDLAFRVARASARELRAVGVDTVFGPVLDVAFEPASGVIGARSFGSDPDLVGRLGAAMIAGYRAGGVFTVAKHFPGHGRTATDSHSSLPTITGGIEMLRHIDLPPFQHAVAAGVDALMVAHCVYPPIDEAPATLSRVIVHALARRELRFSGLIVTDALVMDAIADAYGMGDAAVLAIRAGADMVMPLAHERAAVEALALAIDRGEVAPAAINRSLARLLALETKAGRLARSPAPDPESILAGLASQNAAVAMEVAEQSVAFVDGPVPELRDRLITVIDVDSHRQTPVEDVASSRHRGAEILSTILRGVRVTSVSRAQLSNAGELLAPTRRGRPVMLLSRDHFADPALAAFCRTAAARGPLIHVALRNPHDLSASAGLGATRIAAFSDTPATLSAVARRLRNSGGWTATLPVPLSWVAAAATDGEAAA